VPWFFSCTHGGGRGFRDRTGGSIPPFLDGRGEGQGEPGGGIPYVGDEVVEDGERGALAEVDLVGDAGLLDAGQAELVVLAVDVHGQDLRTEPLSVGCCCCCSGTGKADLGGMD